LRILLANKFFFRNGGSEVVLFQERDHLLQSRHDVIDFAMHDDRNMECVYSRFFVSHQNYRGRGGVKAVKSTLSFIHSTEAVRKIGVLIDSVQPELVHCHNIYHQLTPSIIGAAKARGVPVVLTLHDYKPVCPVYTRLDAGGEPCSGCLDGSFSPVLRKRCADGSRGKSALLFAEAVIQRWLGNYEKVDRFIAPSRFMLDAVSRRFRQEQITLLYNGVDLGEIDPTCNDDGYVLFLGRLSHEKGIETLLRSHAEGNGAWPLVVAGTGPLLDDLKQRYSSAKFVGHLSGAALKKTIAGAAAVVVPSEWYENCPMSVLEAMAYGKPVIGSRMGGIPELVEDGVTGLLFEAGNVAQLREQIDWLMADRARRDEMGRQSRARVEKEFSLEKHCAGLMDIYQDVLSKH
jgi:glycosyltransferase involved in cell wall biosynthesis